MWVWISCRDAATMCVIRPCGESPVDGGIPQVHGLGSLLHVHSHYCYDNQDHFLEL